METEDRALNECDCNEWRQEDSTESYHLLSRLRFCVVRCFPPFKAAGMFHIVLQCSYTEQCMMVGQEFGEQFTIYFDIFRNDEQ